jgi:hypothetical protein
MGIHIISFFVKVAHEALTYISGSTSCFSVLNIKKQGHLFFSNMCMFFEAEIQKYIAPQNGFSFTFEIRLPSFLYLVSYE